MRKLTGYIGAMIIVFALMGSILAGYALNINRTTAVINEYEKVTDVSGLYEHTDEKSYIEYNPASNYTGYSSFVGYDNPIVQNTYRNVKDGEITIRLSDKHVLINGMDQGAPVNPYCAFCSERFYIYYSGGGQNIRLNTIPGTYDPLTATTDINITIENRLITLSMNGQTFTYSNMGYGLTYSTDYYDYTIFQSYNTSKIVYLNYARQSLTLYDYGIATGDRYFDFQSETFTTDNSLISMVEDLNNGIRKYQIGTITFNPSNRAWFTFYPLYVTSDDDGGLGINYTESNRVNNYLMETTYSSITTQTDTLTLSDVGTNNYFYYNSQNVKQIGIFGNVLYNSTRGLDGSFISPIEYPTFSITGPVYLPNSGGIYDSNNPILNYDGFHNVKLSTVLESFNVPAGTTSVKITTDSGIYQNFVLGDVNIDKNLVYFSYLPDLIKDNGVVPTLNSELNKKDYLIYDVTNNFCTVYTYNGIARYNGTPEEIGIYYYEDNTTYKGLERYRQDQNHSTLTLWYDMNDRPTPYITIETTQAIPGTLKYADITKGYAIKSDQYAPVTWNNTYENGVIEILFRAESITGTYKNILNIANNEIIVNYDSSRYNISLNYDTPVDIGTWRNIILKVDLINGKLYVLPVRTFNSFTNVTTDNTSILIGDLINYAPTNIITWGVTTNSLLFNIYSTDVFMNTYGIVMLNPTLNITNYFTNLDNFYQLRLSDFVVYGQSMTINGVTGNVTGNTITFNDETVQIKDMKITYADGHAYISDSHVTIDLGIISDNTISMDGAWYFVSSLYSGYTSEKLVYDWDWEDFILDDKAFGVIYIGLCLIGLIIARKFCSMTITDYLLFVVSIVIALTVPVIV